MRSLIGDAAIEDLPIPFTAVATDLLTGRETWFQDGPLDTAIRASIAIPSVITPLVHGGMVLVDGGLLNTVPIAPLTPVRADAVIAVSLAGERSGRGGPPPLRTFDVVQLSLEAMQRLITRYRLSSYPPDVLIEVPIDSCGTLDFHRATEMIELGRARASAALDSLAL